VGFLAVNPFIGFAEGANIRLNALYEVEHDSLLVVTGMEADRT
jgi:hypothetical protein